jgi:Protein of unknown function (DUF2628)
MSVYTVHQPPPRAGQAEPDAERFVFVRDGFSVWAFLLPPLWMLRHWLWLVLALYVVIAVAIEAALYYAGAGEAGVGFAMLFVSLLIGLEAGSLRRFTLARRGWRNVGVVSGDGLEVAERRFFATWVGAATASDGPPAPATVPAPVPGRPAIVGLFPEPGAHT